VPRDEDGETPLTHAAFKVGWPRSEERKPAEIDYACRGSDADGARR
jgi:hypothetical protein